VSPAALLRRAALLCARTPIAGPREHRLTPLIAPPDATLSPPLQDEEGKDDGRGGRETTKGSIIELSGFGLGAPVPSDVRFLRALSSRAPTSPLRFALRAQVRFDRENLKVYMDFESNNFELQGKYRCVSMANPEARCGDASHTAHACTYLRRDEGYVDDSPPGPSFWSRLFGGGKEADAEEEEEEK
jgi:hypothetical protein